jgi:3-methyladenine DNA glycosylase/8-oxoguanine DNA glycosylase
MPQTSCAIHQTVVAVPVVEPYDFAVSLSATKAFGPDLPLPSNALNLPIRIKGVPVIIEVTASRTGNIEAICRPQSDAEQVRSVVRWVLSAELDLSPFYRLVEGNSKLAPIMTKLHGLKPIRPSSLFDMAITAITEQQLSLASAHHIRNRLVRRFGEPVDGLRVSREPEVLASAPLEDLR